ncbi:MAG: hypothetical protein ABFS86_06505 [Planctomycetota bacterium]
MSQERNSGVTLVDVCIAAAIVVVICGVAYPGFIVANDTMAVSGQKVRLEDAKDRILKALIQEVRTGRLVAMSPGGQAPWVDIHPPVTGIALDKIDDKGAIPWNPAETHRLAFRETGRLKEQDAGEDLNGDGDEFDEFALGVIELTTPLGTRRITERGRVILGLPLYTEDLDGDGAPDPLFGLRNREFTVRLFLVRQDVKGRYHRANLAHSIYLRNAQE